MPHHWRQDKDSNSYSKSATAKMSQISPSKSHHLDTPIYQLFCSKPGRFLAAMSLTTHLPTLNAPVKTVVHIDIWEAVFDQLAFLGYHRTLANCALTSKGNAWLALKRLYE